VAKGDGSSKVIVILFVALAFLWITGLIKSEIGHVLLQISAMLSVALVLGQLALRLRQPPVLVEILAGIILGPTILGYLFPEAQTWLFPASGISKQIVAYVAFLGLISFVFLSGLEIDLGQVIRRRRTIAFTSTLGILVPFSVGYLSVIFFPRIWRATGDPGIFAIIIGTTLSISALPVIARILMDLGLAKKEVGATILTAATIDDALGWAIFAFVLSVVSSGAHKILSIGLTASFFALAAFVIYLRFRCQIQHKCNRTLVGGAVELASATMLATAVISEIMGAHGIFGAFLAGMVLCEKRKRKYLLEKARPLIVGILAPIYFASIGLKVNFAEGFDPVLVTLVFLIACAGKIFGASLGARASGMGGKDAMAVGFGMNARGAVEIVLASLALDNQLIDQRIFVALVIMALATTAISGEAIKRLAIPRSPNDNNLRSFKR
jgi:Kef-type K+ transport system membrane component KefB